MIHFSQAQFCEHHYQIIRANEIHCENFVDSWLSMPTMSTTDIRNVRESGIISHCSSARFGIFSALDRSLVWPSRNFRPRRLHWKRQIEMCYASHLMHCTWNNWDAPSVKNQLYGDMTSGVDISVELCEKWKIAIHITRIKFLVVKMFDHRMWLFDGYEDSDDNWYKKHVGYSFYSGSLVLTEFEFQLRIAGFTNIDLSRSLYRYIRLCKNESNSKCIPFRLLMVHCLLGFAAHNF